MKPEISVSKTKWDDLFSDIMCFLLFTVIEIPMDSILQLIFSVLAMCLLIHGFSYWAMANRHMYLSYIGSIGYLAFQGIIRCYQSSKLFQQSTFEKIIIGTFVMTLFVFTIYQLEVGIYELNNNEGIKISKPTRGFIISYLILYILAIQGTVRITLASGVNLVMPAIVCVILILVCLANWRKEVIAKEIPWKVEYKKPLSSVVISILLIIVISGCFSYICSVYGSRDSITVMSSNDITVDRTIAETIENEMLNVGFDREVINDLTYEQLLMFQNIRSMSEYSMDIECIEAKAVLSTTIYVSHFESDGDEARVLLFFCSRWLTEPKGRYTDLLTVSFSNEIQYQLRGNSLYDDSNGNTIRYQLNKDFIPGISQSLFGEQNILKAQIILPPKGTNYRTYYWSDYFSAGDFTNLVTVINVYHRYKDYMIPYVNPSNYIDAVNYPTEIDHGICLINNYIVIDLLRKE